MLEKYSRRSTFLTINKMKTDSLVKRIYDSTIVDRLPPLIDESSSNNNSQDDSPNGATVSNAEKSSKSAGNCKPMSTFRKASYSNMPSPKIIPKANASTIKALPGERRKSPTISISPKTPLASIPQAGTEKVAQDALFNTDDLKNVRPEGSDENEDEERLPLADMNIPSAVSFFITTQDNLNVRLFEVPIPQMPSLNSPDFDRILDAKIQLCSQILNFLDKSPKNREKIKIKTSHLNDFGRFFATTAISNKFPEAKFDDFCDMLVLNLSRKFGKIEKPNLFIENFPPIYEPAWEHINLCYLLIRRIINIFMRSRKNYKKIKRVIKSNLRSPDPNELLEAVEIYFLLIKEKKKTQEYITKYQKLINKYAIVKTNIYFVNSLLAIFNKLYLQLGYDKPLVSEAYIHSILPLLHHPYLVAFSNNFLVLTKKVAAVNRSVPSEIIRNIIYFWPQTKCSKQAIFLELLIFCLPICRRNELLQYSSRFIHLIGQCTFSQNEKVAETALSIWKNESFNLVINEFRSKFNQLLDRPISNCVIYHWSSKIRDLAAQNYHNFSVQTHVSPTKGAAKNPQSPSNSNDTIKRSWTLIARTASLKYQDFDLSAKLLGISAIFNAEKIEEEKNQMLCYIPSQSIQIKL
ncbi:hypothetical protein TRFO_33349 [Tritrichomonas foetus]|uniref:Phosphoprotein phosphatase n=1 Tax=Tritrichomonas foetus TaxID=1144522 RepID=A0A1J4JS30_9EUKA|nr:hypothetical protein TRFO_33349 [Tritrichomonas foetus]|eukprot:OHT00053.1 hypothetical protein TRFO_33349 [Tritrichomonas foetus]